MLSGRFKREIGEKVFCQPLAMKNKSGMEIGQWVWRTLEGLSYHNITSGPMFRVPGKGKGAFKRASTGDLNPMFIELLERTRKRWANVLVNGSDIGTEFHFGEV